MSHTSSRRTLLRSSAKDNYVPPSPTKIQLVDRRRSFDAFKIRISIRSFAESINQVEKWVSEKTRTRLVTFTNVHMLTEGYRSPWFHAIHSQMDLNCPDGTPLVWLGRLQGKQVTRVCGPEFMLAFCANASHANLHHFFYGGRDGVAERLIAKLKLQNPLLEVAGCYAPPFRAISPEEDNLIVNRINDSGADIVWVSLGCPKQEIWIHEHRDKLRAPVLIAVGLAFDIIAGDKTRAPKFLRDAGLEWLYRLMQEPARLGSRYLKSNSLFFYMLFLSMFSRPKSHYR
jgi:N-acetylglucosaminyldiphosphoundecaprenol N-acetyl-beta-D-mannosaminyltransferase